MLLQSTSDRLLVTASFNFLPGSFSLGVDCCDETQGQLRDKSFADQRILNNLDRQTPSIMFYIIQDK